MSGIFCGQNIQSKDFTIWGEGVEQSSAVEGGQAKRRSLLRLKPSSGMTDAEGRGLQGRRRDERKGEAERRPAVAALKRPSTRAHSSQDTPGVPPAKSRLGTRLALSGTSKFVS